MLKKSIVIAFIICILLIFSIIGYNTPPIEMLFLGDSIAEGIGGVSPLSERERYAYYSVLGIRNNYLYKNRAVSGHRSMDMLGVISREDEDVKMIRTSIKNADIIHVSIIGNDLLYNDLGQVMVAVAQEDYSIIADVLERAEQNFKDIVSLLQKYNPHATLFFQNVYNPVFGFTWLVSEESNQQLSNMGYREEDYRELGAKVLNKFNDIIARYLEQHPKAFYLIDANTEFEKIYRVNPQRGARLVCTDAVHPSAEGHAVLADLTQKKLEELGLASKKKALRRYKTLRVQQLKDLYGGTSLNVKSITKSINKAKDCAEVTALYFEAILSEIPEY